jgi:thiol-disulfide isomerase/thioredoxin
MTADDEQHRNEVPAPGGADPARRRWLAAACFGGVGVAAMAAGGWAWTRRRGSSAVDAKALDALWRARFATPSGAPLALADWRGKPLIVNFWASWCAPCVRELPQFDRFQREYRARGWQVVGLAIDNQQAVLDFLQHTPVSYPIGLAGLEGADLMTGLGNLQGALPFTVVLDAQGRVVHTRLGQTSYEQLSSWASAA